MNMHAWAVERLDIEAGFPTGIVGVTGLVHELAVDIERQGRPIGIDPQRASGGRTRSSLVSAMLKFHHFFGGTLGRTAQVLLVARYR